MPPPALADASGDFPATHAGSVLHGGATFDPAAAVTDNQARSSDPVV